MLFAQRCLVIGVAEVDARGDRQANPDSKTRVDLVEVIAAVSVITPSAEPRRGPGNRVVRGSNGRAPDLVQRNLTRHKEQPEAEVRRKVRSLSRARAKLTQKRPRLSDEGDIVDMVFVGADDLLLHQQPVVDARELVVTRQHLVPGSPTGSPSSTGAGPRRVRPAERQKMRDRARSRTGSGASRRFCPRSSPLVGTTSRGSAARAPRPARRETRASDVTTGRLLRSRKVAEMRDRAESGA